MELFENRRCLYLSITVFDSPSKCVLDTVQFVHIKSRETCEERIEVVKTTTHQDIRRLGRIHKRNENRVEAKISSSFV